jgi:IS5 family transposase
MVDATLITAPSPTNHKEGETGTEMHQTKKCNSSYYGMKVHVIVRVVSGLIYSVISKAANVNDLTPASELLHVDDEVVYDDYGHHFTAKRPEMAGSAASLSAECRFWWVGWFSCYEPNCYLDPP